MEITQHCVVGLTWTLKDTLGEVLDELDSPVEFLVGGDDLLAKIEEALQGHSVGDAALRQEIVRLADTLLASAESREAAE